MTPMDYLREKRQLQLKIEILGKLYAKTGNQDDYNNMLRHKELLANLRRRNARD